MLPVPKLVILDSTVLDLSHRKVKGMQLYRYRRTDGWIDGWMDDTAISVLHSVGMENKNTDVQ